MEQSVYIFDLDGTLIDSMPYAVKELEEYLLERDIEMPPDLIKSVIALGYVGVAKYYVEHFPLQKTAEQVYEELILRIRRLYEEKVVGKLHVESVLRKLKEQGKRLNVLTASPHVFLDPCIKRLGWTELFENTWTVEDFPVTKADPKIYLLAAERLGVKPQDCVMLDDSVNALRPAKQAGLKAVGVYDEFSSRYEEEMKQIGDLYIHNFTELL